MHKEGDRVLVVELFIAGSGFIMDPRSRCLPLYIIMRMLLLSGAVLHIAIATWNIIPCIEASGLCSGFRFSGENCGVRRLLCVGLKRISLVSAPDFSA